MELKELENLGWTIDKNLLTAKLEIVFNNVPYNVVYGYNALKNLRCSADELTANCINGLMEMIMNKIKHNPIKTTIREYCEEMTVEIEKHDNGRLVITAYNEGGHNTTQTDIFDIFRWAETHGILWAEDNTVMWKEK